MGQKESFGVFSEKLLFLFIFQNKRNFRSRLQVWSLDFRFKYRDFFEIQKIVVLQNVSSFLSSNIGMMMPA